MERNIPTTKEIWAPIPDWPYEVSNFGKVRRSAPSDAVSTEVGKILEHQIKSRGYRAVMLHKAVRLDSGDKRKYKNVHRWQVGVHRLVMWAFYGKLSTAALQVNHIDGNPSNNTLTNLEFVTPSQNKKHSYTIGTSDARGSNNGQAKLVAAQVTIIREFAHKGLDWDIIADQFGISRHTVKHIVRRTRWDHVQDGFPPLIGRKVKLTPKQIIEIRDLYKKLDNYTKVGEQFGVSAATVRDIILGNTWKHVG